MYVLLEKYKMKLSYLPVSEIEKRNLLIEFEKRALKKLLDLFYECLDEKERNLLETAPSDEELVRRYLDTLSGKIEETDFLRHLDETYIDILTNAINELPSFNQ